MDTDAIQEKIRQSIIKIEIDVAQLSRVIRQVKHHSERITKQISESKIHDQIRIVKNGIHLIPGGEKAFLKIETHLVKMQQTLLDIHSSVKD